MFASARRGSTSSRAARHELIIAAKKAIVKGATVMAVTP